MAQYLRNATQKDKRCSLYLVVIKKLYTRYNGLCFDCDGYHTAIVRQKQWCLQMPSLQASASKNQNVPCSGCCVLTLLLTPSSPYPYRRQQRSLRKDTQNSTFHQFSRHLLLVIWMQCTGVAALNFLTSLWRSAISLQKHFLSILLLPENTSVHLSWIKTTVCREHSWPVCNVLRNFWKGGVKKTYLQSPMTCIGWLYRSYFITPIIKFSRSQWAKE